MPLENIFFIFRYKAAGKVMPSTYSLGSQVNVLDKNDDDDDDDDDDDEVNVF